MLPDLKLKIDFPGFGSIEVEGDCCEVKNFQQVLVKFTPNNLRKDINGLVIQICRDGNCYVQELKPLSNEEAFDGIGLS
jgi:hypothetical protein